MTLDRRSLIKGIGVAGATLTFSGYASANGTARYLVRGSPNAANNVRSAGFEVLHELRGNVLVVSGSTDAGDDLEALSGVNEAFIDFEFTLEEPEIEANQDADEEPPSPFYDELQWDKQVQEVAEAHKHATGEGSRLAVIDTGIDHTHPDLGNVNTELSASVIGAEIGEHEGDAGDHGTHVAGTVGATGDLGVVGTAPDAELVSLRVFGAEGGASFGDILIAADYAAEIGADAANMSIGTEPIPPEANAAGYRRLMEPVFQAGTAEGTFYVGSAGNSDANLQQGGFFTLPNSLQGVLSTSATGPNDERAFYSNYGTNEIDVGAPGGGYETLEKTLEEDPDAVEWPYPLNLVFSTLPLDEGEYGWKAGTSMAAPQVTGLAGLVRELDPDANANQVESAIKHGAEGAKGRSDAELGAGRVNALKTVERVDD